MILAVIDGNAIQGLEVSITIECEGEHLCVRSASTFSQDPKDAFSSHSPAISR